MCARARDGQSAKATAKKCAYHASRPASWREVDPARVWKRSSLRSPSSASWRGSAFDGGWSASCSSNDAVALRGSDALGAQLAHARTRRRLRPSVGDSRSSSCLAPAVFRRRLRFLASDLSTRRVASRPPFRFSVTRLAQDRRRAATPRTSHTHHERSLFVEAKKRSSSKRRGGEEGEGRKGRGGVSCCG